MDATRGRKVKTDKRDARALYEAFRLGRAALRIAPQTGSAMSAPT